MHRNKIVCCALCCAFALVLLEHASYYLPFLSDDALISLQYAKRFLAGHGLTWTDGRPVEGYSNLLWILGVSLLGALGVDLVLAARLLGFLCMTATPCFLTLSYYRRAVSLEFVLPAMTGALFFILAGPTAVWTFGGLEQPLFAALLAGAVALLASLDRAQDNAAKTLILLSFVLGLLCLTRPDGPLFAVCCAAALLFRSIRLKRSMTRDLFFLSLFPVLFTGAQSLFRLWYYGEAIPNTALVKLTPSWGFFFNGLQYLGTGFLVLSPFSFLALAALTSRLSGSFRRRKAPVDLLFILFSVIAWSLYVAIIGGDIFPAYRHITPLLVFFSFALAEGVHEIQTRFAPTLQRGRIVVMAVAICVLFLPFVYAQFSSTEIKRAKTEDWEWIGKDIALLLKNAFKERRPRVAVTAAGCIPYWSDLPSLDMMGLNDYYLPRNVTYKLGDGQLGHEIGDGRYVLNQRPDIILFDFGDPPKFKTGVELDKMQEFHDNYKAVKLLTILQRNQAPYIIMTFFHIYSQTIGVAAQGGELSIPGFLFTGENCVGLLNDEGKLVAWMRESSPVNLRFACVPAARREIVVKGANVSSLTHELTEKDGSCLLTLQPRGAGPVQIEKVVLKSR